MPLPDDSSSEYRSFLSMIKSIAFITVPPLLIPLTIENHVKHTPIQSKAMEFPRIPNDIRLLLMRCFEGSVALPGDLGSERLVSQRYTAMKNEGQSRSHEVPTSQPHGNSRMESWCVSSLTTAVFSVLCRHDHDLTYWGSSGEARVRKTMGGGRDIAENPREMQSKDWSDYRGDC